MADLAPLIACRDELIAFRGGYLADDHYAAWAGSTRLADGSITLPYPDYREAMDRLWEAFAAAGYRPEPADYHAWMQAMPDWSFPATIVRLDRAGLAMCLLAIRRGERFCDGYWDKMVRNGALLAAAERAIALEEEAA